MLEKAQQDTTLGDIGVPQPRKEKYKNNLWQIKTVEGKLQWVKNCCMKGMQLIMVLFIGSVQLLEEHFPNNDFLEVRVILRGKLEFYARVWFWRYGFWEVGWYPIYYLITQVLNNGQKI